LQRCEINETETNASAGFKTQIPPYGLKQRLRPNSDCPPSHGVLVVVMLDSPRWPLTSKIGEDLSG